MPMLDSPKRYNPRHRPDAGPRPEGEGHGEAPIRRPVHVAQAAQGPGQTDWEQGITVNGHADDGAEPTRGEAAPYPRVVSQQGGSREVAAPYEAGHVHAPGKGQQGAGPVPQMTPPPGADYGQDYGHPPAQYAAPPPRSYAPRAGPTVYAQPPYAPQSYTPPAPAPAPAAARPARQAPRSRPPARDQYKFGRGVAYVSMGVAWLLIACGALGPVQIALGVVATRLGTAGSVLIAGLMAVGGLFMLLAAHAVLAIFDQSDAMQTLAGLERARRADEGRKDGA